MDDQFDTSMQNWVEKIQTHKKYAFSLTLFQTHLPEFTDTVIKSTSQLRRASVCIRTNMADGTCKDSNADFFRSVKTEFSSTREVEFIPHLSYELNFLKEETY